MNPDNTTTPTALAETAGSRFIRVFATMPDGSRRMEQYRSRKAAADGIRDCRKKGGSEINIFDPFLPKRASNTERSGSDPK